MLTATEQDREIVQSYLATLGAPNRLLQLAVCCSQASMEASARPVSKAAAKRVWLPSDKQNKLKEEAATASASASAETEAKETEKKATDTVSDESRRLWADELVDPCYVGEDIDLRTLTPDQLPELRRCAAVAIRKSMSTLWLRNEKSTLRNSRLC